MAEPKGNKNSGASLTTTIRVSKEIWKRFRIAAIERDLAQQEALEQALVRWLQLETKSEPDFISGSYRVETTIRDAERAAEDLDIASQDRSGTGKSEVRNRKRGKTGTR